MGGGAGMAGGGGGVMLLFMRPAAAGNINLLEIKRNKKTVDSGQSVRLSVSRSLHQADGAGGQFLKM